jgi:hypothetical protein
MRDELWNKLPAFAKKNMMKDDKQPKRPAFKP